MSAAAFVNLGPKERRKRWLEAGAAAMTAALVPWLGVPMGAWLRVLLVALVTAGVFCALQAAEHTCAILAYRGRCNFDGGVQQVRDAEARRALVDRANGIVIRTAAIATMATVIACTL